MKSLENGDIIRADDEVYSTTQKWRIVPALWVGARYRATAHGAVRRYVDIVPESKLPVIPREFKALAQQLLVIGYKAGFAASGEAIHADNHSEQNVAEDAAEFAVAVLNGDWA